MNNRLIRNSTHYPGRSQNTALYGMILLFLLLTACAGSADFSSGYIQIYFEWPESAFVNFPGHLKKDSHISFWYKNLTTEDSSYISIYGRDNFSMKKSLSPGMYKVGGCSIYPSDLLGMNLTVGDTFEIHRGKTTEIKIGIDDMEALLRRNGSFIPADEIMAVGMFGRKAQIDGQAVPFEEIMDILPFTLNSDKDVNPYKEAYYDNEEYGIRITVQNVSDQPKAASACEISRISFRGGNGGLVILPGGLSRVLNMAEICHAYKGVCGTPQAFKGTPYYGIGYDNTKAVYIDGDSGDMLTVNFMPNGMVSSLDYDFDPIKGAGA